MTARMAGAEGRPSSPFVAGPLGLTMRTHEYEMFFSNTRAGDFSEPANDGVQAVETLSGIPLSAWAQDDQVHGAEVRLTAAGMEPIAFHHAVDGQLTSRRGVLCAVRTADCLPVFEPLVSKRCTTAKFAQSARGATSSFRTAATVAAPDACSEQHG